MWDGHHTYLSQDESVQVYEAGKSLSYFLHNVVIDRLNKACSIDIIYIPMKHDFLYLTAIIDWYSRCIVGWEIDDTLNNIMIINACGKAFKVAKLSIINSDQSVHKWQYIDFICDNGWTVRVAGQITSWLSGGSGALNMRIRHGNLYVLFCKRILG